MLVQKRTTFSSKKEDRRSARSAGDISGSVTNLYIVLAGPIHIQTTVELLSPDSVQPQGYTWGAHFELKTDRVTGSSIKAEKASRLQAPVESVAMLQPSCKACTTSCP
jgi:hypothetical protein